MSGGPAGLSQASSSRAKLMAYQPGLMHNAYKRDEVRYYLKLKLTFRINNAARIRTFYMISGNLNPQLMHFR